MSKLGRHERSIRLPEEDPWGLPPAQRPEREPERTAAPPRPAPAERPAPVPAGR